ncbi:MAG: hypothetical protein Q9161_002016 [Pseudevernia consocians]
MQRSSRVKRGLDCSQFYDFQPAILCTNKQINKEARRFLYDDNLFVMVRYLHTSSMGILWKQELTLLAAEEKAEVCCSWSALRVSLHVELSVRKRDDLRVDSQIVIAADELPVLCRILRKLDNGEPGLLSNIKLVLRIFPSCQLDVDEFGYMGPSSRMSWHPHSLAQQRRLLEPFAVLHSMPDMDIIDGDGETQQLDAQLMANVKAKASRPPYSMEEVLDTTAKIKEQGNEAFRVGDFALALSLYESAFDNIEAGERYLDKSTEVGEGGCTEQLYFEAHFLLAFRIWSNSVAALLRLQQWKVAHRRATVLVEKIKLAAREIIFDPKEVAKVHHRRALASEGMGKMARAVEEIREALCLDSYNMSMKTKLKEWQLQAKNPKQIQAALEALTM